MTSFCHGTAPTVLKYSINTFRVSIPLLAEWFPLCLSKFVIKTDLLRENCEGHISSTFAILRFISFCYTRNLVPIYQKYFQLHDMPNLACKAHYIYIYMYVIIYIFTCSRKSYAQIENVSHKAS